MTNDQPNVQVDPGDEFDADGITVVFREDQMVLDFKNTTPRVDQIGDNQTRTLVIKHQPVRMRPRVAKILRNLLDQNIQEYEERFGEIDVPEQDSQDEGSPEDHSYIG